MATNITDAAAADTAASNMTQAPLTAAQGVQAVFWTSDQYVEYEEVSATAYMREMPRFGGSQDFSDFFQDESRGYGTGMLFALCVIIIPFFIWLIMLCIIKVCCSKDSCGFLTGEPLTSPYDAKRGQFKRWQRHTVRTRCVFALSSIMVIVFATLFVVKGLTNVEDAKNILADTNMDIQQIVDEAQDITGVLVDVGRIALEVREQIKFEIDKDLCPADPGFNRDPQGGALLNQAEVVTDMLNDLGNFVEDQISRVKKALDDVERKTGSFDKFVDGINNTQWVWAIVAIPLILLPAIMILGAFAASLTFMNPVWLCCMNWLMLPIMILWLIAAVVACAILAVSATGTADFCTGADDTPDTTVMSIVANEGFEPNSFVYESTRYYVHQCQPDAIVDPFLFLREYDVEIQNTADSLLDFGEKIKTITIPRLALICNKEYEPIMGLIDTMSEILIAITESSTRVLKLTDCGRIVPMYTNTVYDGICDSGITGLTWMFASLIFISFFGFLMLTTRPSYQNSIIQKHEGPKPKEEYIDEDE